MKRAGHIALMPFPYCQATWKTDPQATRKIDPSVSSPGGFAHEEIRI